MLIGTETLERLRGKAVIVFGAGGVGGFALEALARTGIGTIGVVDCDTVDITNINRQILALQDTVGRLKTEVAAERIAAINPDIVVRCYPVRLTEENVDSFSLEDYDYVVDAIDDVKAKLALIEAAVKRKRRVLSCMGMGNRMDPRRLRIAPMTKTFTCPLAKRVRKELRLRGVRGVTAVFSDEEPDRVEFEEEGDFTPASISFVPASAGLMMAYKVVRDLIEIDNKQIEKEERQIETEEKQIEKEDRQIEKEDRQIEKEDK